MVILVSEFSFWIQINNDFLKKTVFDILIDKFFKKIQNFDFFVAINCVVLVLTSCVR